ncbi:unannotated protein [freshwater metagenome]|uniref:Unannotated protein n=1 Tax=freshwater metagenome TaxID=449393 RepID=A0A6J7LET7_9ZZZZ
MQANDVPVRSAAGVREILAQASDGLQSITVRRNSSMLLLASGGAPQVLSSPYLPPPTSDLWEYRIEDLTITDRWNSDERAKELTNFSVRLNELGGAGWELISYQAIPLVGRWSRDINGYAYLGMLKRRLG